MDWQRRVLERLVYPDFGDEPIGEIKRRRIIALLDRIEDNSGAPMADMTLAVIRPVFGWHALRDENYANPIVKGMARIERNEHRRDRILDDDELRAVWKTAEERNDAFGAYLRFLLLTMARRDEARELIRAEIKDGQWLLPAARNKTKLDLLRPLSNAARALVESQPEIDDCPYVFTTNGKNAINSLSRDKRDFQDACGVTRWTLHDLRRTRAASCRALASTPTWPNSASAMSSAAYGELTTDTATKQKSATPSIQAEGASSVQYQSRPNSLNVGWQLRPPKRDLRHAARWWEYSGVNNRRFIVATLVGLDRESLSFVDVSLLGDTSRICSRTSSV